MNAGGASLARILSKKGLVIMVNRSKRTRPEYLYAALLFMGAALLLVILIICGSCEPQKEPAGESSAQTSENSEASSESSVPVVESSEEESSQPTPEVEYAEFEVSTSDKMTGLLSLTDPAYAAGITDTPDGLTRVSNHKNDCYGLSGTALMLRLDAIEALNRLTKAFTESKGENTLIIHEAYKPGSAVQEDAVRKDLSNGNTVYFTLFPADKDGDNIGSGKYLWLVDNCNRFGYILRYPSEKASVTQVSGSGTGRVYRFVGYEHAAYMAKYHLCLEEYLDALRPYTAEAPLAVEYVDASGDKQTCYVYYVAAGEGETTTLTVRGGEDAVYSVSGNGSDGFIVTCYE